MPGSSQAGDKALVIGLLHMAQQFFRVFGVEQLPGGKRRQQQLGGAAAGVDHGLELEAGVEHSKGSVQWLSASFHRGTGGKGTCPRTAGHLPLIGGLCPDDPAAVHS